MPELLLTPGNVAKWLTTYAGELDAFGETEEGKRLRAAAAMIVEADKRINRPEKESRWILHRLTALMRKPCVCHLLQESKVVGFRTCSRCRHLAEAKHLFADEYTRAAHVIAELGPTK